MNEQRNLLLAIVLSALVLFGWSLLSPRVFPTATPRAQVFRDGKEIVLPQPAADPAADSPAAIRDIKTVIGETPRLRIVTPRLQGSINLTGAKIDDLVLTGYRETIARNSPYIRLFTPSGAPSAYFAQFGWTGTGEVPNGATRWTASGAALTPETPVTLGWTNAAGVRFEIGLAIDRDFLFTVTQRVTNGGTAPLTVRSFGLVSRSGRGLEKDASNLHVGPIGYAAGSVHDHKVDYDKLVEDGPQKFDQTGGWLGITDKYWQAILIPDQRAALTESFRAVGSDRFQTDFARAAVTVAPGGATVATDRLFAGAKEVAMLDRVKAETGAPLFDRTIYWGWFWFIAQPIFMLLDFLFHLFGNFGLAIIGLTFLVRLALYPVANKQFSSMARMRVITPKMKALQEKWKDDKVRQQQEIMTLYKTEKVNPLAGCLPIFLQIPIFYALYKTLIVSIEMRHQPFVLWIKDLSAPDPLSPVNLFGLLPFTPPHLIALGVLPVILGFTMWLQQKLNPTPMDDVQKQVFAIMPWMFMFVMGSFAAGLQVYWITNNLLSIAQQAYLYRRHGVAVIEPEPAK